MDQIIIARPAATTFSSRYAGLMLAIGVLALIIAACGDMEVNDDEVPDERPAPGAADGDDVNGDDQDTDEDSEYRVVEADSEDGEKSVTAITYREQPTEQMDALIEGELATSGICLGVETPGDEGFVSVVWPADVIVDFENGDAVLIDENDDTLAREGDRVSTGGGFNPDDNGSISDIAPADCRAESYWMSGAEVQTIDDEIGIGPAIANGRTVYFPQWQEVRDEPRVAQHGRLTVESECIYLVPDHDSEDRLLIWPPDYSVEIDEQERVVVVDQDGEIAAREGEHTSSLSVERGTFEREQYGIPDHCEGEHAMVFDPDGLYYPDDDERADRDDSADEPHRPEAQQYAEAFDVSEEEATRRLDLQGRIGPAQQNIMENESHRFGGMFWEHEPEYRMVVLLTEGDEDDVLDYFYDDEIKQIVEVRTVELTLDELHQIQHEVTELLLSLNLEISSGTSVQDNHVVVYAEDVSLVEETLEEAGHELPEHVVLEEEEMPTTLDQPEDDS